MRNLIFKEIGILFLLITLVPRIDAQTVYWPDFANFYNWELKFLSNDVLECGDFTQSFRDDFDGSSLDSYWVHDDELTGPCAQSLNKSYNASVSNGLLTLVAKLEDVSWDGYERSASSVAITGNAAYKYGKYEIRCKLPNSNYVAGDHKGGGCGVFWLGGSGGEIDIIDFGFNNYFETTIFEDFPSGGPLFQNSIKQTFNSNLSGDFHTYSVTWTPFKATWRFDENIIHEAFKYYSLQKNPLNIECGDNIPAGLYKINRSFSDVYNNFRMKLATACTPASDSSGECDAYEDLGVNQPEDYPIEMVVDYVEVNERLYNWCNSDNFVITSDMTITGNYEYGSITVENGATLTIEDAELKFGTTGKIIIKDGAKLHVVNSRLMPICDEWMGIVAYSRYLNDQEIVMSGRSIVSKAKRGIEMMAGGTTLSISDSKFIDCETGIYVDNTNLDKHINSTTFIRNAIGINNRGSKKLFINGCTFRDNSNAGIFINSLYTGQSIENCKFYDKDKAIYSIDSPLDIKGNNEFHGCLKGIYLGGTAPLTSGINIGNTDYEHNLFNGVGVSIYCIGNESPFVTIQNCKMEYGTWGVTFFGANQFLFRNNTINYSETGVIVVATGDNMNSLNCNSYNDIDFSDNAFVWGNTNTSFLGNESTNNYGQNFGFYGAYMPENIGSLSKSASNSFVSNHVDFHTEASWFFGIIPGAPFKYWYWDVSSQEPVNPGNYTKEKSLNYENHCEKGVGVFDLIDPDGDGENGVDPDHDPDTACKDCVKDSIDTWVVIVTRDTTTVNPSTGTGTGTGGPVGGSNTGTDGPYSDTDTEAVLDQWINYGLYVALETEDYEFAEEILQPLSAWRWQKRLYGVKILKGNYVEAEQVLNTLSTTTQDEIYFKEVQYINLKRLRDVREAQEGRDGTSTVTQAELDQLRYIADSPYPTKGYAHSIYSAVTGEDLPFNLPDLRGSRRFESYAIPNSSNINQGYGIYPNPAHDELTVSLEGEFDLESISLYDITGKKIYHNNHSGKSTIINVRDFKSGIYFISILKSNGEYLNNKIIID